MIAFKFLRRDGSSVFAGFSWPLPANGQPGPWVEAAVDVCHSGVHACRVRDLPYWAGQSLWRVELEGEVSEHLTKVVAPRGRLVERITAWEDGVRDEYVRACADRAHELVAEGQGRLDDWAQVIEPSIPEGPALLGFIPARISEERDGLEGYQRERDRQAAWLAERLGL